MSVVVDGQAHNDRRRAMVYGALCAQAPVDVITLGRIVHGAIAFISVTQTITAPRLTTTIVIRNDVALSVDGILASANPRHRRHLRSRRTGHG